MIFANGDCAITYQQEETIPQSERTRIEEAFYQDVPQRFITDMMTTENSLTFLYEPVSIMEANNTLEPCGIAVEKVTDFLTEKEFFK